MKNGGGKKGSKVAAITEPTGASYSATYRGGQGGRSLSSADLSTFEGGSQTSQTIPSREPSVEVYQTQVR